MLYFLYFLTLVYLITLGVNGNIRVSNIKTELWCFGGFMLVTIYTLTSKQLKPLEVLAVYGITLNFIGYSLRSVKLLDRIIANQNNKLKELKKPAKIS